MTSGSSWLILIKCTAAALKNPGMASEYVVQPIVDRLFQPMSRINEFGKVSKVVYFYPHVLPHSEQSATEGVNDLFSHLSRLSSAIYSHSSFPALGYDVRLLLPQPATNGKSLPRLLIDQVDRVSLCQPAEQSCENFVENNDCKTATEASIQKLIGRQFSLSTEGANFHPDFVKLPTAQFTQDQTDSSSPSSVSFRGHKEVCLGGTFDRPHNGHKQLLTTALLACSHRITVGVTTGSMIAKKTLCELIDPVEKRIDEVRQFINDVDPSVEANIVPITDAFGPSIVIEDLEVLVVSQETLRGGHRVNEERVKKGLPEAKLQVIELVGQPPSSGTANATTPVTADNVDDRDAPKPPIEEENKTSSSTQRFNLLGQLLKTVIPRSPRNRPYVIGLTGGIATGKSNVGVVLEHLGAKNIDCDKLGHIVYEKSNPAYAEIISRFGESIANPETGEIDRKKLGAIVFGDKTALSDLCSITWPRIADRVNKYIDDIAKEDDEHNKGVGEDERKRSVVIINAAILLEAKWDNMCDEIWLCMVPHETEVKRIVTRDRLSEEEAKRRIATQMSNAERIARAHVVINTLWRHSVTRMQIEKAWKLLKERLAK